MRMIKKTPRSKNQDPEKLQASSSKKTSALGRKLRFGIWSFPGSWILVFGFWSSALGVFLCCSPLHAADSSPALTSFLAAQTNLHTWTAELTQIRRLKTLTQPLTATGRVWFAAPNKFRWEIGQPAQTIAVRGRDELLVIYPRLKRVERYPLVGKGMGQWKDTLALLEAGFPRSLAEMEQRFKIISVTATNDVHNVALQPKSSSARRMMPRITLSATTNDFQLRATELEFGDGSTMRNEFHHAELNPPLDEALFAPKLDPSFKIVEPMKH